MGESYAILAGATFILAVLALIGYLYLDVRFNRQVRQIDQVEEKWKHGEHNLRYLINANASSFQGKIWEEEKRVDGLVKRANDHWSEITGLKHSVAKVVGEGSTRHELRRLNDRMQLTDSRIALIHAKLLRDGVAKRVTPTPTSRPRKAQTAVQRSR